LSAGVGSILASGGGFFFWVSAYEIAVAARDFLISMLPMATAIAP
jgi:hypothetical protein